MLFLVKDGDTTQNFNIHVYICKVGMPPSSGLSMGHIYLSHSHPIAIDACPIPWDSHHIIIILMWNTIQLKLLNL